MYNNLQCYNNNKVSLIINSLFVLTAHAIFHEPSMQTFNASLPTDSLFGYSITYLPSTKSVIAGAPRAGNGQAFYIDIDSNEIKQVKNNISPETWKNINAGFWFGATVRAANNISVICAPRYTDGLKRRNDVKYQTNGVCYVNENSDLIKPLRKSITKLNSMEKNMDTIGWSLDVEANAEVSEVLIGSPGMWKNRAALYRSNYKAITETDPIYIESPNNIHWGDSPKNPVMDNYGISVARGKFFADELQYAVGATYGNLGQGKVYFYNSKLENILNIYDDRVGSLFGAALCAVLLGDARASVLVGAPAYADRRSYDLGAVYLYRPSANVTRLTRVRMINGTVDGGYFGHAIISLGDMDGDHKEEIAIGAPYEQEGRGAVYIYTGAGLLNYKGPVQVIRGQDKWNFGFSLAALQNHYDNGCNELAVGAPNANTVALFRCMASITINVAANFPDFNILNNKTRFDIDSCVTISYPRKPQVLIGDIIVNVDMPEGDYTIIDAKDGLYSYNVSLDKKPEMSCKKITVSLLKNVIKEHQVLCYTITARLKDEPNARNEYEGARPLLSEHSALTTGKQSLTISNCGNRSCLPVLSAQVFSSISFRQPYVIGSTERESVSLWLTNAGEPAYSACVLLELSKYGSSYPYVFYGTSGSCVKRERSVEQIICKPDKVLHKGDTWKISRVEIETKGLTSVHKEMKIQYSVYNECENGPVQISENLTFHLTSDFSLITLTGEAEGTVNLTEKDVSLEVQLERTVNHVYIITNRGSTNWVNMKCKIKLENNAYTKYTDRHAVEISVDSESRGYCTLTPTLSESLVVYECDVGNLWKNQKARVNVFLTVLPEFLGLNIRPFKNVSSYLDLFCEDRRRSLSLTTTFLLHTAKVPSWMLIVALCVGLLALIIIAFTLYECGFLRRKNKEQLQQLKHEIRRQTVRLSRQSSNQKQKMEDGEALVQDEDETTGESLQTCHDN